MFKLLLVAAAAAAAAIANAHYTLVFPPSRGQSDDLEPQAPCGGFNTVGTRHPFPLGDGFIKLDNEHEEATVTVLVSFSENPTNFTDWTKTASGAANPPLRDFFKVDGESICIGVNIKSLGYEGAKDGANATILVQYSGGDGDLFQCTDVTLKSDFTTTETCSNQYVTSAVPSSSNSAPPPASTTSSGNVTLMSPATMLACLLVFAVVPSLSILM